jgi:hypothetical protein
VLFLASVLVPWLALADAGTLEPQYRDHLRHMRYVDAAFEHGLGIYTAPARSLPVVDAFGPLVWPDSPYLYPPGALLFFLPFAGAMLWLEIPGVIVCRLLITVFLFAAHVATYFMNAALRARGGSAALRLLFVSLFHFGLVFWCWNAQYDAVPVALLVWAGATARPKARLGGSALAVFMKFQSLLLLPPLVVRMLANEERFRLKRSVWVLAGLLVGASLVALWLARGSLVPAPENPLHWSHGSTSPMPWVLVALTCVAGAADLRKRNLVAIALYVMSAGALLAIGQLQMWHAAFLFAGAAVVPGKTTWERYAVWVIAVLLLLDWGPSVGHLTRLLQDATGFEFGL